MTYPATWAATTLGHIRRNDAGRASTGRPDEVFELWSVPAYGAGRPEIVRGADIGSTKQTVAPGTVLVCKINPRINRIWVVGPRTAHEQIASTEWISFFPVPGLEPRFLQYYLQQDSFRTYVASNVSGVGGSLMRVRPEVVERFPFPLPPLAEQRRIVAAIEEHLSRLDAAAAALERVRTALPRYRAAVLKAACEGKLVESELRPTNSQNGQDLSPGWKWSKMSEIGTVQGGITKNPARKPVRHKFPFLRVANVGRGKLDLSEIHEIELRHGELERLRLEQGDLLIVEGNGSPTEIGRLAVWNGQIPDCVHQNHLIRHRPNADIRPAYIAAYWNSPSGMAQVMKAASSTSGLYTLSVGKVSSIRVPVPPVSEQDRILAEVDRRLSLADAADRAVSAGLAKAKRLRQAILKRAFEGRLVRQDPNDEPASALLERIRTARRRATT